MPGRYRAIWLDSKTGHHFLVALSSDGFASRAYGPMTYDEAIAWVGRDKLSGSREMADNLNDHPPGRIVDVTPLDPFTPAERVAFEAMKQLVSAPPNGGERLQARFRLVRALLDTAIKP